MPRFALTIEYDGRPYFGWQRQRNGPSVQQAIEEAIARVVGAGVRIHAAGRTDAGVHATAMRAHCDIDTRIAPFRLGEAINAHLRPAPVAVIACESVADDWHARFSCLGRRYRYDIINRRARLTWQEGLAWRVVPALDEVAMQAAADILVGHHDFTTFRSAHCQAKSPVRTLDRLDVTRNGDRVAVHAAARSFLHHQVRSMVGCLALVGQSKWSVEDMRRVLEARDRTQLGLNGPPDGLYFVGADYAG